MKKTFRDAEIYASAEILPSAEFHEYVEMSVLATATNPPREEITEAAEHPSIFSKRRKHKKRGPVSSMSLQLTAALLAGTITLGSVVYSSNTSGSAFTKHGASLKTSTYQQTEEQDSLSE